MNASKEMADEKNQSNQIFFLMKENIYKYINNNGKKKSKKR